MTKAENDKLIKGVYEGEYDNSNLPEFLFLFTFFELQKKVDSGYGSIKKLKGNKLVKAANFRTNINTFSGAKTWQNIRDLHNLVTLPDGQKLPFKDFRKYAKGVNEMYNKNYLRAELHATQSLAQSAKQWDDIEETKDIFPLLKYVTIGDGQVRPEHASWDGIIRPVDDPFWSTRMPPNGWGCRCDVQQLEEGNISSLKGKPKNPDKLFSNNPGKDNFIFDPEVHPYFKGIPKDDKINNFGFGFQ